MRHLAIRRQVAGPAAHANLTILIGIVVLAFGSAAQAETQQSLSRSTHDHSQVMRSVWAPPFGEAHSAPTLSERMFGGPSPGQEGEIQAAYESNSASWVQPAQYVDGDWFGELSQAHVSSDGSWCHQILPDGLIYRSYLAGVKESRFAGQWVHDVNLGWMWDITLGGRVGILRYGTTSDDHPEGWQLDIEGAGMPRLDLEHKERDLIASDFRFGIPLTYGRGSYQTKFAYYHLSSHLGDEYMVRYSTLLRRNYSRDVIVWGHSYFLTQDLRLYGEAGWAFNYDGGTEPWEFQVGVDYSPVKPTGHRGSPFVAVNGHLRQEFDFGGNLVVQTGWQWRGHSGHLFRVGLHYFQGMSDQWEFFDQFEDKLGFGIWYDF